MSSNVERICMNCGRTFIARNGKYSFCSKLCKKKYGNHISFSCKDCRTLPCEYRNLTTNVTPSNCPNYNFGH